MYALLASPHLTQQFAWIAHMFPSGLHLSIWLVVPFFGAAIAAFFGLVLGAPVLKLRGDYLAIVTLGFGEIIRIFINNLNSPLNITNGPQGLTLIDPITIAGVTFTKTINFFGYEVSSLVLYYYLFLGLTIITVVICMRLQDSRLGRAWLAIAKTRSQRKQWESTSATSSCSHSRWAQHSAASRAQCSLPFKDSCRPSPRAQRIHHRSGDGRARWHRPYTGSDSGRRMCWRFYPNSCDTRSSRRRCFCSAK